MSAERACPGLEDIAAFIDGRLEGAEKEAVAEHLGGDCEACYRTWLDTLRFQRPDAGSAAEPSRPTRNRKRALLIAGPLAAAAVLLLAIGLDRLAPIPRMSVGLVPDFIGEEELNRLGGASYELDRSRVRGPEAAGGPDGELGKDVRALRLGALVVDLHLALSARQNDQAEILIARIRDLAGEIPGGQYSRLRGLLESDPDGALELSSVLDEVVLGEILDRRFYELGKWAETGRLAAAARQPELFEDRRFRRLVKRDEAVAEAREHLRSPLDEKAFGNLERLFTELLEWEGRR